MARIKQVAFVCPPGQRKPVRTRTVVRRPPIVISDSEDDRRGDDAPIVISDSEKDSSDDDSWWL